LLGWRERKRVPYLRQKRGEKVLKKIWKEEREKNPRSKKKTPGIFCPDREGRKSTEPYTR